MVMRIALSDASKVGPEAFAKIVGGAMFGDPAGRSKNNAKAGTILQPGFSAAPFAGELESKVKVFCATGDPVRLPFDLVTV